MNQRGLSMLVPCYIPPPNFLPKAMALYWSLFFGLAVWSEPRRVTFSLCYNCLGSLLAVGHRWLCFCHSWTAVLSPCEVLLFSQRVKTEAVGCPEGGGWEHCESCDAALATFCDPKQVAKSAQIQGGGKTDTTYLREELQRISSHI